jgi:hypothetical protein
LLLERIAPPIWKSQLAAGHLPAVKSLKWDAAYFFAEERELGREKAYLPTQQVAKFSIFGQHSPPGP